MSYERKVIMNKQTNNEIPWELVGDYLTGNISDERNHQLQQWIGMSEENHESFVRILELWKSGTENYLNYKQANEEDGWKALQNKITTGHPNAQQPKVIHADFNRQRRILRNIMAIASVCVGFIAILWYFSIRNQPDVYITGEAGQKEITLSDGTNITMFPSTRIEVYHSFNKRNRTITMASGEADFDVTHRYDLPFIVKMGNAEVRDIGTSFIIRRQGKMIHVAVSSGKVSFIKKDNEESRELEAGSSASFNEEKSELSEIAPTASSEAFKNLLVFENTPLSAVIESVQKVYAKNIAISDNISNRKLTAKLYDMPFNMAIEVICTSLDLEYTVTDNVYVLRARMKDEPVK
jgi:transmembrane sensor